MKGAPVDEHAEHFSELLPCIIRCLPAALLVLPDVLTLGCPVCAAARRVHAGEKAVSGRPVHQVSERGCATAS